MPYNLEHWNDPRKTIACKYVKNDFAYLTHGAVAAFHIYSKFNLKYEESKNMTILDYGCGTARMARLLCGLFKTVVAYDPNTYCIEEAKAEGIRSDLSPKNLILTSKIEEVPECDIAFSFNVIEHLDDIAARQMLLNLKEKVIDKSMFLFSVVKNENVMNKFFSQEQYDEFRRQVKVNQATIQWAELNLRNINE